jgi:hypothetical protein
MSSERVEAAMWDRGTEARFARGWSRGRTAARVPRVALCASDGRRILLCRCGGGGRLRERGRRRGCGGRRLLSRGGDVGSRGFFFYSRGSWVLTVREKGIAERNSTVRRRVKMEEGKMTDRGRDAADGSFVRPDFCRRFILFIVEMK